MATVANLIESDETIKPCNFLIIDNDKEFIVKFTHLPTLNNPELNGSLEDYCKIVVLTVETARGAFKEYKNLKTAINDIKKINPNANIRRIHYSEWARIIDNQNE